MPRTGKKNGGGAHFEIPYLEPLAQGGGLRTPHRPVISIKLLGGGGQNEQNLSFTILLYFLVFLRQAYIWALATHYFCSLSHTCQLVRNARKSYGFSPI